MKLKFLKKGPWIVAIGCLLLIAKGCYNSMTYLPNQNLQHLYAKGEAAQLRPMIKAYHTSKQATKIWVCYPQEVLNFKKDDQTGKSTTALKIILKVYKDYESQTLVDTTSRVIYRSVDELRNGKLCETFKLQARNVPYLLVTESKDLHADHQLKSFRYIHPYNYQGPQNFLIRKQGTDLPVFKNYLPQQAEFRIAYSGNNKDSLPLEYFKTRNVHPPAPAFIKDYEAPNFNANNTDSIYFLPLHEPIELERKGLYVLKGAPGMAGGYPFRITSKHYPDIKIPKDLRTPLIYLTSKKEYKGIAQKKNTKAAVDDFWLNIAENNEERARQLIQTYYQGVIEANQKFTKFRKGWKTDRGMIYTIYGPPPFVYRNNEEEKWIYPQTSTFPRVEFNFKKVHQPPFNNLYKLKRNKKLKRIWYKAVDKWRQGNVNPDG